MAVELKDRIKKWLGLDKLEQDVRHQEIRLNTIVRQLGRIHNRPSRHDQIEKARKRRKKPR